MKKFEDIFEVRQAFHTGLWGWRRINGCINLKQCTFRSKGAATRDRNRSQEKAIYDRTGELSLSK